MVSIAVYTHSFVQVEKIEKEVGRLDAASVEPPMPDWSSFADKQNESRQYVYNGVRLNACYVPARPWYVRARLAMCARGLGMCARGLLCARVASFITPAPQRMYK
jgi:hypothetical protein